MINDNNNNNIINSQNETSLLNVIKNTILNLPEETASPFDKNNNTISQLESTILKEKSKQSEYKETISFLSSEIQLKTSEYQEKKRKLNLLESEYKENMQLKESIDNELTTRNRKTINKKIQNFVEIFRKPMSSLISNIAEEYSGFTLDLFTSNGKSYMNSNNTNNITTKLFVIYNNTNYNKEHVLPFQINDKFYCFVDLLKEVCRFLNIDSPENFNFIDSDNNIIDLTYSILSFMPILIEKTRDIPRLYLVPLNVEKIHRFNIDEYNDARWNLPKVFDRSANVWTNIEQVEDNLMQRIKNIVFFLLFILLLFIIVMNQLNIRDHYFIYNMIQSNWMKKSYFRNNKYKLENTYQTINTVDSIYDWLIEVFIPSFNYYDEHYRDDTDVEKGSTTLSDNYIVLGKIRYLRFVNNYTDQNEVLSSDFEKAYGKFLNILKYRELNEDFSFVGTIESYNFNKGFYCDVSPSSHDMHLIYALMKQREILNQSFKVFAVKLNLYNANNNYIISTTWVVEKTKIGYMKSASEVCTWTFWSDLKSIKQFKFTSYLLLLVAYYVILSCYSFLILKNMFFEFKQWGKKWYTVFSSIWVYVKVILSILFVLTLVFRTLIYIIFLKDFTDLQDQEKFYTTSTICNLFNYLLGFEMIMLCLTLIYFLQFLDENIVGPFFTTIMQSIRNVLRYVSAFILTLLGYSMFCHFFYGNKIEKMNTILRSFGQVFMLVLGDISIGTNLMGTLEGITTVVLVAFSITFFVWYYNWWIVIFVSGYRNYIMKWKDEQIKTLGVEEIPVIKEIWIIKNKFIRGGKIFLRRILRAVESVFGLFKDKVNHYLGKKSKGESNENEMELTWLNKIDNENQINAQKNLVFNSNEDVNENDVDIEVDVDNSEKNKQKKKGDNNVKQMDDEERIDQQGKPSKWKQNPNKSDKNKNRDINSNNDDEFEEIEIEVEEDDDENENDDEEINEQNDTKGNWKIEDEISDDEGPHYPF